MVSIWRWRETARKSLDYDLSAVMAEQKAEEVPEKSLEYWLSRATDPYLAEASRPDYIKGFCDQVNEELEGHQIACRLLAHKVQSPYEKEALQALAVLDACVRNCGQRFHNEIAKFRFLNELIKILSPKYLGSQTGEKVKQRTVELLYAWKQGLRHLPKVKQAYDMLKEQGIISQDPTYMDEIFEAPPPPPKPKLASFEDEEKARLLAQLLKSKNADDLQAANRLIKSMVKAEDQKVEKMTKRSTDIQTAVNNARLLAEMVSQYDRSSSSNQDRELMKELADSLHKLRPALYRYAGEAAEGDEEVLADVLSCNDEVSRALEDYKTRVESHVVNNLRSSPSQANSAGGSSSLLNFDLPASSPSSFTLGSDLPSRTNSEFSLSGDDVLMLGGGGTPLISRRNTTAVTGATSAVAELSDIFGQSTPTSSTAGGLGRALPLTQQLAPKTASGAQGKPSVPGNKGLLDLDELSESLIQRHLPTGMTSTNQLQQTKKTTLRDLTRQPMASASNGSNATLLDALSSLTQQQQTLSATLSGPSSEVASGSVTPAGLKPIPLTPHPTPTQASGAGSPTSSEPSVDLLGLSAAMAAIATQEVEEPIVKVKPLSLDGIDVALEAIQPGSKQPVTVMDRDQLKVVLHYAANRPRPDALTTVVSITSCKNQPLSDVRFEGRVRDEDDVLVKLLHPTSMVLPAYNPIFPQTAITQILLLAAAVDPGSTRRIPLEFTLTYASIDQRYSITGCASIDYWRD